MHEANESLLQNADVQYGRTNKSIKSKIWNYWVEWTNQLGILIFKNSILAKRNWKGSAGQILAPIAIVLFLFGFQHLSDYVLSKDQQFPPTIGVSGIPPCISRNGVDCTTILYCPPNITWVDKLMERLAENNGLEMGVDIKPIGNGGVGPDAFKADNVTITNYILSHQNTTQNVVVFTSAYFYTTGEEVPKDTGYMIWFNETYSDSNSHYSPAIEVMRALDEAILQLRSNNTKAKLEVNTKNFPRAKLRFSSYDVVAANGGIWFYLPPMITFFVLLTEIVMEKETRLRLGMQMMGLNTNVYWLSWFLNGVVFISLASLVLILAGMAAGFDVFRNSSFFAVYILFLLHGLAVESLAFLLSTFISRSKTAQTLGYGFILVGFVFQCILCSGYGILVDILYSDDIPKWVTIVRWIFQFYPPFNLAKVYSDIAERSSNTIDYAGGQIVKGPGFSWSDLYQERTITGFLGIPEIVVPPPIRSYYYLIMNIAVFLAVTWYLDQVIVNSEHGSAKPWYFLFTPEYWGFKRSKRRIGNTKEENDLEDEKGYDSDVEDEKERLRLLDPDVYIEDEAIRVVNLSKTFRKFPWKSKKDHKAVKNISFSVQQGEIFCLLGTNGAGKSTTLNMLTGILSPDSNSGYASIHGLDIQNNMSEIRKLMGVTPQHDILWPELTAMEHLKIFAKLKGMKASESDVDIPKKLKQMDLWGVRDQQAGSFSGGMKRRLSVAIAALGDPKILYLDEPSTGMDPVNRRALWDLIIELKKDKAIILTTHDMAEAQLLSDKVAIMVYGKLRCIGDSLHLKTKYGSGYRLELVLNRSDDSNQIIGDTLNRLPGAALLANDAGSLSFKIPQQQADGISNFIEYLEQSSDKQLIREWGIAHTTLEEVFLEISKKHGFVYDDEEVGSSAADIAVSHANRDRQKLNSYPMRALLRKNFSIQKRQKGTNCCQIVTPITVMGLLLLLQLIIRSELGDDIHKKELIPSFPWPLNAPPDFNPFPNILYAPRWNRMMNQTYQPHHGINYMTLQDRYDRGKGDGKHREWEGGCVEFFLYTDIDSPEKAGSLNHHGNGTGLLGKILQNRCYTTNTTYLHVPYFEWRNSSIEMETEIFNDLTYLNGQPLPDVDKPPLLFLVPDGTVTFIDIDRENGYINYTYAVNDNPLAHYHRGNNFTRFWLTLEHISLKRTMIILQGRLALLSMINNAFTHYVLNETAPSGSGLDRFLDIKWAVSMPYYAAANVLDALEAVGTLLYPVALTLQLPIYVYIIVLEKSEKLRELMKSHGMKTSHYIFTNYLFNYLLYVFVIGFFWVAGVAIGVRFFTETHPSMIFVFFFGWGHAVVCLSFLLSSFINSKRAATVVGYVIALFGSMISLVVCVGIYGRFAWAVATAMPTWLLVWPQFAFVRGIYLMNLACAQNYACYGPITELGWGDELSKVLLFMYIDAIFLFLLGLYLENVLPQEYGVPKHPLFFLSPIKKLFIKDKKDENGAILMKQRSKDDFDSVNDQIEIEDDDCRDERFKVNNERLKGYPLVIHDLHKKYNNGKVAVKKLCLSIPAGECFGLLGENGAGKTTTISICTGMIQPTSGYALVGGYDIRNDIDKVHLVIGVCPQFSILWENLTVEEHLLFYARLKGIPPKLESEHVKVALKKYGLSDASDRLASALSGGMQRRLSIAIALIGGSEIAFLDEPTTGLDPASKHQIWKLINNAKQGRAIVLTTHSMEEAELLSSRIGIMVTGRMCCLGSPLHLKNKFADGYNLTVNFEAMDAIEVNKRIIELLPTAKEVASFKTTKEFRIQIEQGKVSQVFRTIESNAKNCNITDWSLSQVGLEDVFQRIVKENKRNVGIN